MFVIYITCPISKGTALSSIAFVNIKIFIHAISRHAVQSRSLHADLTCRIILMTMQRASRSTDICLFDYHTSFKVSPALTRYLVKSFTGLGVRSLFSSLWARRLTPLYKFACTTKLTIKTLCFVKCMLFYLPPSPPPFFSSLRADQWQISIDRLYSVYSLYYSDDFFISWKVYWISLHAHV